MSAHVACPLPWARALHRQLAMPRGELHDQVSAWLSHHGWRCVRYDSAGSRCTERWFDPLDGDDWTVQSAINLQATREAQHVLTPRGWTLAAGTWVGDTGTWRWIHALQSRTHRRSRGYRLTEALRIEGLAHVQPPALAALWARASKTATTTTGAA